MTCTRTLPYSLTPLQVGAFMKASKNSTIFIDNVSDLKPAPMTSDAVFKMAWVSVPRGTVPHPPSRYQAPGG